MFLLLLIVLSTLNGSAKNEEQVQPRSFREKQNHLLNGQSFMKGNTSH